MIYWYIIVIVLVTTYYILLSLLEKCVKAVDVHALKLKYIIYIHVQFYFILIIMIEQFNITSVVD